MNCQSHLYRGQDGKLITRRWFFEQCGVGLGAIALGQLFGQNGWAASPPTNPLAPRQPPLPAKLPAGVTPTQFAAYTVVTRVLLNLDETITKE